MVSVCANQAIEEAVVLMSNNRIRHLSVLDGNRLTGVIQIGEVIKAVVLNGKGTFERLSRLSLTW